MDLLNVGRLHQCQAQNDSEAARAILGTMVQKRETLKSIKREIAQLVENERRTEEDLVRLGVALGRHNYCFLPNEILSRVFTLLALCHGTMKFPITDVPPQLVVSHVCSHWRRVALRTPELWSDTHLNYPSNDPDHVISLHQRWLFRARTFPVSLSIKFDESLGDNKIAGALRSILLPIQVKKLTLCLTYKTFMALSTFPEAALSGLLEVELDFLNSAGEVDVNMSDTHPLITRLRSVAFRGPGAETWFDSLGPSLPWSQLRSLTIGVFVVDSHFILGILREVPMLEKLSLGMRDINVSEQLTMSSLGNLSLYVKAVNDEADKILRTFVCPSLTEFSLAIEGNWTSETFEVLKRQYNMQELREARFKGDFALPVSAFLCDAPMLHSLSLGRNAIMDDEAVTGISNGTLGRFLRKLNLNVACDVGEVLGIVEARKNVVDGLIKNGCSWREEITVLKDVTVHSKYKKGYKERVLALKEAGITITFL